MSEGSYGEQPDRKKKKKTLPSQNYYYIYFSFLSHTLATQLLVSGASAIAVGHFLGLVAIPLLRTK